ncbi:hypothetical protein PCC9214_01720 [Planktothrix tepida]|uniref:DUF4079 domain-containing protein n=2 Tax=Planktothrix TaxID=54304 RepID=A0A1J1LNZ9_9CYAN|nr:MULTISPECIES: DUF4079 domain-containing protein [Planktothrix]MBD2481033.1 DUF4079 domain-containing protein [Planktothrix sp. FACHB-1365]CAD5937809.1 hypothetical protein PCC9214_01720 [Planktothrix tepida]CAD5973889.1 hypothetical protein NO713_04020 [Planktothrix pseudagardhii]CUR33313.1 conserved membrane hypothetical protein [Planktothrix tepida PCC 9214]
MDLTLPASIKPWLNFFHPLLMWILLGLSVYAMYLGVQIRRTREAQGDTKKELIKGKFNLKHHQIGSLLLALMVLGTIGGMGVTYINNGKLFVGPHLLAGLGMTGMIAISASLTPYMQKGADWARVSHIALNTLILGLFAWQAVTGMEIVQKIISNL